MEKDKYTIKICEYALTSSAIITNPVCKGVL